MMRKVGIVVIIHLIFLLVMGCESEVLYCDPAINGKYALNGTVHIRTYATACTPPYCIDTTYEVNQTAEVKRVAKHKIEIYGLQNQDFILTRWRQR